ncbi:MAG: endonuclease MutS2 [Candidatus Coatesbacteria bacterium]|nr:endonuclease MutS2 [Candidatus Coatesbacteria bacterium]
MPFDEHSLELIDLPPVLERLAGQARTVSGKRRAHGLRPLAEPAAARRRMELIAELQVRLGQGETPPLERLEDLEPVFKRLDSPRLSLERADLWALHLLVVVVGGLTAVEPDGEVFPRLCAFLERLESLTGLRERFLAIFDERGEVRDDASAELHRLRSRLEDRRRRLQSRLTGLLDSAAAAGAVSEELITRREGRFVIPLLRDFRGRVPGIVHGQSKSGATLYVEPLEVVEANNELAALGYEIAAEIQRLLAELTEHARRRLPALRRDYDLVGELDLLTAAARLVRRLEARPCELTTTGHTRLIQARHPLLVLNRERIDEVVPIDLELGEPHQVLLITGPNAGGKTVALKTVGLLTVLAQCGLPIPVGEGSSIGWRQTVLADIGDEQSVAGDLSTFSYHVRRLGEILEAVGERALVLLDEIGTGTDPDQGAALAMATLEKLRSHGAWVVATSHYDSLKGFVYGSPGMENAAVAFDPQTLEPLYRLTTGTPGTSNTLAMARNLGLNAELVAEAEGYLDDDYLRLDRLIEELESERKLRRDAERGRREALEELIRVRRDAARRVTAIEAGRTEKLQRLKQELQEELKLAEAETAAAARRLRDEKSAPTDAGLSKPRRRLQRQRERLARELQERPGAAAAEPQSEGQKPAELAVGQRVRLDGATTAADLLELKGDEAVIAMGAVRMTVPVTKLTPTADGAPRRSGALDNVEVADRDVSHELNLRGMRVEEALEVLDKYLDDAALAGHERVRIIHGKGTGALRFAVLDFLRGHRHVAAFSTPEPQFGGTGVTEAELR